MRYQNHSMIKYRRFSTLALGGGRKQARCAYQLARSCDEISRVSWEFFRAFPPLLHQQDRNLASSTPTLLHILFLEYRIPSNRNIAKLPSSVTSMVHPMMSISNRYFRGCILRYTLRLNAGGIWPPLKTRPEAADRILQRSLREVF